MQVATPYGKSKKPPSNVIQKFQKVWIIKMPWAKAIFNYQSMFPSLDVLCVQRLIARRSFLC